MRRGLSVCPPRAQRGAWDGWVAAVRSRSLAPEQNRELQIMRSLDHPNVVGLKHSFLARGDKVPDPARVPLLFAAAFRAAPDGAESRRTCSPRRRT